jgi:carbamoyl-phosphate synthase small subunit
MIGNYGSNDEDFESAHCQAAGVVVRELCDVPSNFRSREGLGDFLRRHGVVGIAGVDTRAITRKLRRVGVMMGTISTDETPDKALARVKESPGYGEMDLVELVSTPTPYEWEPGRMSRIAQARTDHDGALRIVVVDYGVRRSILKNLHALGSRPIVLPCRARAEHVLEEKPDGVLLSPGPGDPRRLDYAVKTVQALLGEVPLFGICLGNQLLGHALGGDIFKLKFGHRGGNHPVRCNMTGMVRITSQNHGYSVRPESLEGSGATVSQTNLNDDTVEGIECPEMRAFSIQYHAEASPGPLDSRGIFGQFVRRIRDPDRWREIVPEVH